MKQSKKKANVQVALDEGLRDEAVEKAELYGFDNLPSMVRYVVVNIVNGELVPTRLGDPNLPYFDEETQENIGIALKEYKEGKFKKLGTKKAIKKHFKELNAKV